MLSPIVLTAELASLTTALLLVIAVPLAWLLARSRAWWAEPLSAIVSLPLVLPPTVLGFYLLIFLGPDGPLSPLLHLLGLNTLAFSFTGLVIGSALYSLPFMVQPVRSAFRALGDKPFETAATLRASPRDAFFTIALPLARGGILTGAILSFAHTVGEFGVVLMIGGNLPGKTKVLSIAIYDYVDTLEWTKAHILSAGMVIFAFIIILAMMLIEKHQERRA